jgi:hypothetical protein
MVVVADSRAAIVAATAESVDIGSPNNAWMTDVGL